MIDKKRSIYQFFEEITPELFLHYCSMSDKFLLMSRKNHLAYENSTLQELEEHNPSLYYKLEEAGLIIEEDRDETAEVIRKKHDMRYGKDLYNVVVNTTLDCNLNCWYCYENRIKGSSLSIDTIELIKRNIAFRFEEYPFHSLKMSFFGGEPFMEFEAIRQLLEYSKKFCQERNIELIADFTTNATLINAEMIDYLKQFRCHFQITLDGDKEKHNKIKYSVSQPIDAYSKVIESLRMIDAAIPRRWVAVRINFNNRTLNNLDRIVKDIDFLDRRYCYIILKKVWQVDAEKIDNKTLCDSIQKLFDLRFLVDYYVVPRGCVCFADRESEVLFNYDGKVFKCTTISKFDESNKLGVADQSSGEIIWDAEKIDEWLNYKLPSQCHACKWFPVCLGVCNRQLIAHKGENLCDMEGLNLSPKEYLMYLFKYNLLKNQLEKELMESY